MQQARIMAQVINQGQNQGQNQIHAMTRNTFANLMVQIDVPQEANTVSVKNFFDGTHFSNNNTNINNTSDISLNSLFLPAGYSASSSSFS